MQTQPRLVAISGPLQGQRFDLGEQGISIGRVGEAVLAIDHVSVSRRHCLFVKQETSFKVQDLASKNGTWVNGERVAERLLQHGDQVVVGNSAFVFLMTDEDVSLLLDEVRLSEDAIDPASTIELRRQDAIYLNPEKALADTANARVWCDLSGQRQDQLRL